MSGGWVAAGVRGGGLLRRRVGVDGARRLAGSPSLQAALVGLEGTSYGRDVHTGMDVGAAQHGVSATALWHLRILAGWGPPGGAGPLAILAGRFEIANITGRLLGASGRSGPPPYQLGTLATVWTAVSAARSPAEVRAALGSSPWGDPGSDEPVAIRVALQLAWARRVYDGVPGASDWARVGTALLVARLVSAGVAGNLGAAALRDAAHLLGGGWTRATSLGGLAGLLPEASRRALAGVHSPAGLWEAEMRWWATVDKGGAAMSGHPAPDAASSVGVAVQLLADAWRVRAALAVAAAGGGDLGEVLGEVD